MNYQEFIDSLNPDVYNRLKTAVELGRWPDGRRLTPEQQEHCLQAIIAYDLKHKTEQQRVGYIHTSKHRHCGSDGSDEPVSLTWKD